MSITVRELLETAIYNVETGGINLKMGIDQLREVWHEIDVLDKELNDDCLNFLAGLRFSYSA